MELHPGAPTQIDVDGIFTDLYVMVNLTSTKYLCTPYSNIRFHWHVLHKLHSFQPFFMLKDLYRRLLSSSQRTPFLSQNYLHECKLRMARTVKWFGKHNPYITVQIDYLNKGHFIQLKLIQVQHFY